MNYFSNEEKIKKGHKKAISKSLLGLIVAYEAGEFELGSKICEDDSFDAAFVDTAVIDFMKANFIKTDIEIPLHDSYCGHAISEIVSDLKYGKKIDFPSIIRTEELYKKIFFDK